MDRPKKGINERSLANLKSPDKLPDDERTQTVRVRAKADALEWFAELTAQQRGVYVHELYQRDALERARKDNAALAEQIRQELASGLYSTQTEAGKAHGISKATVSRLVGKAQGHAQAANKKGHFLLWRYIAMKAASLFAGQPFKRLTRSAAQAFNFQTIEQRRQWQGQAERVLKTHKVLDPVTRLIALDAGQTLAQPCQELEQQLEREQLAVARRVLEVLQSSQIQMGQQ